MSALSERREVVLARAGYVCDGRRIFEGHRCGGRLQDMHVLPKQSIRTEQGKARRRCERTGATSAAEQRLIETPLSVIAADPANGICGCYELHRDHDLHRQDRDGRSLRIPRSALPDRIFTFAEHWALESLLDREFPKGPPDHA